MSASAIRTRLLDNLRIRLPGAIDSIIKVEIFNTLDELCRDARIWREDIDLEIETADVTAETTEYQVDPSDGVIVGLMQVLTSEEVPIGASMSEPGILVLDNPPGQADTYTVTVALSVTDPVRSADAYPHIADWILEKHYQCVLDGVMSRMMSQVAKPYSNERLAIYHGRKFRNAVAGARIEALHSNKYRGQNWQFPQAFMSVRRA